jgi:uncharacterized protein YjbI with pentapeptide repeats
LPGVQTAVTAALRHPASANDLQQAQSEMFEAFAKLISRLTRIRPPALSESNLVGLDLGGANMEGADLRKAKLSEANLSGSMLNGADLRQADLAGAYLCFARLRGADLREAILAGADLEGADLRESDLRGAILEGAAFSGAILSGAIFDQGVHVVTASHALAAPGSPTVVDNPAPPGARSPSEPFDLPDP